jgi:hypothetical protein
VLLLTALPLPRFAHAAREPRPKTPLGLSTPEVLDRAVAKGEIDRDTADLYLAYALSTEHERVPARYMGAEPWDGTLPLLHLQRDLSAGLAGRHAREIDGVLDPGRSTAANDCGNVTGGSSSTTTANFYIDYGTIGGELDIGDYETSLQTAWDTEIGTFSWAAPPMHDPATPGDRARYHVVIADLGPGLHGFVSAEGDFAGNVGNNPNTAWAESDAVTTCMVVSRDFSGFAGTSQQALDATTARELNQSIQFGYGARTGDDRTGNVADQVFVEGGATWMEDEVFDSANDNYRFLWPNFTRDMGTYSDGAGRELPHPYWVVLRALIERFGVGTAGGGEAVLQRYWEEISRDTSEDLVAMNTALVSKGTNLPNAYHAAAVALRFNRACSGGYAYPYCLQEGPAYVAAAGGGPPFQGTIASTPGSFSTGSVRDNYALNWVKLPSTGTYDVVLTNRSTGGLLRTSVACDTGTAIAVTPLPVAGAGGTTTLQDFSAGTCKPGTVFAVITNQNQTAADPASSTARPYTLRTVGGSPPKCPGFESDSRNQVVGTATANNLFGTSAADIICGLGGNDTLSGLGGSDLLLGGPGVDTLHGGDGADVLNGGDGNDGSNRTTQAGWGEVGVFGNEGNDRLIGDLGTDDLFGGPGRDRLEGGAAWDILVGSGGNDTLLAGDGNDELRGNAGIDSTHGGTGFDRAVYIDETGPVIANLSTGTATGIGIGTDTLTAVEDLFGTANGDTLTGNGGSNFISGYHGNDRLVGQAGNDALFGENGNDTFNGGPGNDRCVQGPGTGTRKACESTSIRERPAGAPASRPAPAATYGVS